MYRLIGTVTALAPLTVSYFKQDGLPRTPHGEVMLNGGTFRGPLRKAAYRAVRSALSAKRGCSESEVFSLMDAYMLGEGMDVSKQTASESTDKADPVAEAALRHINPLLNMFGRWKVTGRLSVGELRTPATNIMTVGAGARTDMFERDSDEVQYLSEADQAELLLQLDDASTSQERLDEISGEVKRLKRQARDETDGRKKEIYGQIDDLERQKKEIKAERKGATESIKHPLEGVEAIAPGSTLSHRMTLVDEQPESLGLLLAGLAELARDPVLGGRRHIGCGAFSAKYQVLSWEKGSLEPTTIGTVVIGDAGFHIDGEALHTAFKAFQDGLEERDFTVHSRDAAGKLAKA